MSPFLPDIVTELPPQRHNFMVDKLTVRLVWSNVNHRSEVRRLNVRKRARGRTLPAMSTGLHNRVKKEFGELLKAAREQAGYESAARLAILLNIEPARYRYWERGQALPDIPTLIQLCHHLGLQPQDLVPEFNKRKAKQADHLKVVG